MLSAISILGVGIALACVCLISLFILDELAYDRMHPAPERTYLILRSSELGDGDVSYGVRTSGALAPTLRTEFPEVKHAVRTFRRNVGVIYQNRAFEEILCVADEDIFQIFKLDFRTGGQRAFLAELGGVAIT